MTTDEGELRYGRREKKPGVVEERRARFGGWRGQTIGLGIDRFRTLALVWHNTLYDHHSAFPHSTALCLVMELARLLRSL
jgi:hypothetical protein